MLAELSDRELQVLSLMAEGRSNRAISEQLFLTVRTVESHIASILIRLGIPNDPDIHRRVQAVVTYLTSRPQDQTLVHRTYFRR